jgi:hypothetical protein
MRVMRGGDKVIAAARIFTFPEVACGPSPVSDSRPHAALRNVLKPPARDSALTSFEESMRPMLILGVLLIAAGLFAVFHGVSYSRDESVLKIGELEAKVRQEHAVPQWIGGLVLGAGIVLTVVALKRR